VSPDAATVPAHAYVHVPFCARRCSYCDFAIAVRPEVPVAAYVSGVAAELAVRGIAAAAVPVWTLYLGGGTPSRLGAAGIPALLEALAPWLVPAPGAEVTVEANPEDVTPEAVAAWRAAGVNRLSLGVQSFDPKVLAWMHRTHAPDDVARAVQAARAAGIADVSVDLIFAVPDALDRDWRRDLEAALALEPTHLSVYGLTVEPQTPLGRWVARGAATEAPDDRYEAEFLATHDVLEAAGFEHYEVSNYARPGYRARHNAAYWLGVPYLGLGPSAHGFDGTVRRWNLPAWTAWHAAVAGAPPRDPVEGTERLTAEQREAETVYLGLRTVEGLVLRPGEDAVTDRWVDEGWAARRDGRLALTPTGWLRMDALAAALTHVRSP
jgi:oxygen-independent coproporphyrinogen-3 oxidase